jgi:hypothetical protein
MSSLLVQAACEQTKYIHRTTTTTTTIQSNKTTPTENKAGHTTGKHEKMNNRANTQNTTHASLWFMDVINMVRSR